MSVTLITASVYMQGHYFVAYGKTYSSAMVRLFEAVQAWFDNKRILNVSRNTVEKLEQITDFNEVYNGLATIDGVPNWG